MDRFYKILTSPSLPVVLCTFIRACCHVGIIKTMGIYLEDITLNLGTTSTDIGISLGLLGALSNLPAPLIAALYRRHSIRRLLLIVGACLPATGVALTAMATSHAQMTVYLSLTGFGNCVVMVFCAITLHRVAAENYNLLYSIAMTGFGFGMVLLPILAEVLHKAYGWRGGLLIMAALMANIIPCAVAIRLGSQDVFQSVPSSHPGCTEEEDCNGWIRQDTTGDGSDQVRVFRRIMNSLRQSDFHLDPVLNVIFVVTFVFKTVYSGWHSFLVPHVLQRGISVRNTIILTFSASIGNIFGRVAVGVLTNNLLHPVSLYIFATLMNITALLCDVFFANYYAMLVTSCVSAMSIGGRAVLGALIVKERASPTKFDIAYAVNEFFGGFGLLIGGYLSGMIADRFSSYNATFKLLAGIDVIVLLLIMIVRWKPKPTST